MKVGDLVLDKELGEVGIIVEVRNALYVVLNLVDGGVYPVPCGWASEELEVIDENR